MIGRFAVILPLAAGLVPGVAVGQELPAARPATVAVTGTASVTLEPDHAVVQFGVVTRAATAAQAGARNAEQVHAVLAALADQSIADEDLETSGYGVRAEWDRERGARDLSSYVAQNTVRVTVRDLDRVGAVIDAAMGAGANEVSALRFGSRDADEARRRALADAVGAARLDAEVIAAAAGGRLGALLEVSTGGGARAPVTQAVMMEAARARATPIVPGDLTVSATVTAVWAFVPNP
jgi:uncharacterized protein YggE